MEAHLAWHRGRILLIAPAGERPTWLRSGSSRLQVVSQEEVLQAAMSSELYVPHGERGGPGGSAPDGVFADEAVLQALPFVPGVSERVLVVQPELLIARHASACDLFAGPSPLGLSLFAHPSPAAGPGAGRSAQLWGHMLGPDGVLGGGDLPPGAAGPYYEPCCGLQLLEVATLHRIWRALPVELSATLDSAVRHGGTVDAAGLHYSLLVERSRRLRQAAAGANSSEDGAPGGPEEDWWAADLEEFARELPKRRRRFLEVALREGSAQEWHDVMASLPPVPADLPQLLHFTAPGAPGAQGPALELDCLRERWLRKLLPRPSSFEDAGRPPDRCARHRAAELQGESLV